MSNKKNKLLDFPEMTYETIRPHLKNGDLMFEEGAKLSDWFLKKFDLWTAGAPLNHVGIIRLDYGRVKLFEAVMPVAREITISNWLKYTKGNIYFARVETRILSKAADDILREKVIKNAVDLAGTPYEDVAKMVGSFLSDRFRSVEGDSRIYCSEYASLVWKKAGLDLLADGDVLHPSPAQLLNSPIVTPLAKVVAPIV